MSRPSQFTDRRITTVMSSWTAALIWALSLIQGTPHLLVKAHYICNPPPEKKHQDLFPQTFKFITCTIGFKTHTHTCTWTKVKLSERVHKGDKSSQAKRYNLSGSDQKNLQICSDVNKKNSTMAEKPAEYMWRCIFNSTSVFQVLSAAELVPVWCLLAWLPVEAARLSFHRIFTP